MWNLIVSVSDHCLFIYCFSLNFTRVAFIPLFYFELFYPTVPRKTFISAILISSRSNAINVSMVVSVLCFDALSRISFSDTCLAKPG